MICETCRGTREVLLLFTRIPCPTCADGPGYETKRYEVCAEHLAATLELDPRLRDTGERSVTRFVAYVEGPTSGEGPWRHTDYQGLRTWHRALYGGEWLMVEETNVDPTGGPNHD